MDTLFPGGQPIARVYIDNELPHLDKLFDYTIPEKFTVTPGMQVRVRFAGKLYSAWVVEVVNKTDFPGKLQSIERIVSTSIVLPPKALELAKDLARRNCVPVVKIISAMIPPRHAGGEKAGLKLLQTQTETSPEFTPETLAESPETPAESPETASKTEAQTPAESSHTALVKNPALENYQGGAAFAHSLNQQNPVRAIWQLIPTDFPTRDFYSQSALITTIYNWALSTADATILVILPTSRQVTQFQAKLAQLQTENQSELKTATISSTDSPAQRYKKYIAAAGGAYSIIIGTRSLAYQPVPKLAGIVIFDDGDSRHHDPQSPYLSTLDISLRRSYLEKSSLLIASAAPSIQATALAESNWAHWLLPIPQAYRKNTAIVQVIDHYERQRQGSAGKGRLPAFIQTKIRKALNQGPVLVSVPRRGWISIISCTNCRQTARCVQCQGPIRVSANGALSCAWCADPQYSWHCHKCSQTQWKPIQLGSERTFEELGRAFPTVKIIQADAQHQITDLPAHTPCLVVATPGAEPFVVGGYTQIVVLDGEAVANRPELWALEEAMRRWIRLLGMVKTSGELTILGINDIAFAQALIRKDPVGWAKLTLAERNEVGFFPAKVMIAIDGAEETILEYTTELTQSLNQIKTSTQVEILGTTRRYGQDIAKVFGPHPTRLLLRSSWENLPALLEILSQLQTKRSLKKQGLVTIRVNPRDLL
ncbi:hypothetical protein NXS08_02500 [Gleimia sp. 6138-11-ORH1]|uniref:primosomal protein N' family DNA-binding protein n=1 Tax=Gleimia sp. 6138-11-ORH1 TaxID=2973937 RepID=UPI00216817D2|nr:hypothetical protein [Gleimia sp. 6138-11-ORH1]MCS4484361.1 hypothetical protein [Gleimia sp. 6138-11-ORH1]